MITKARDIEEGGGTNVDLPSSGRKPTQGIIEIRRLLLKAPLGAVAALILAKAGAASGRRSTFASMPATGTSGIRGNRSAIAMGDLDFEAFFQECADLTKQAFDERNLNEDLNIARLSTLAARLRLSTVPDAKTGRFAGLNPPVEFGPVRRKAPLAIILWKMAPGAILPAHDHTPADVLSICLSGEARVRHFDIVGNAPEYDSKKSFLIRESRNLLLTPGRVSGLTQVRDNIHTFHAGEQGAVGIDINSFLPGDKSFSFLDFSDRPADPEKRTYEAVWKKIE